MTDDKNMQAPPPPPEMSPDVASSLEQVTAAQAERLHRHLTDALKAGMIEGLKKIQAQIARSTDLNFQALRSTSIQRHPEGQDLVVVVDVVPKIFHDGAIGVGS